MLYDGVYGVHGVELGVGHLGNGGADVGLFLTTRMLKATLPPTVQFEDKKIILWRSIS